MGKQPETLKESNEHTKNHEHILQVVREAHQPYCGDCKKEAKESYVTGRAALSEKNERIRFVPKADAGREKTNPAPGFEIPMR